MGISGTAKKWVLLLVALGAVGAVSAYLLVSGPSDPPVWMRIAETARTIMTLEKEVENFKAYTAEYPPSKTSDGGTVSTGAANLYNWLLSPSPPGWVPRLQPSRDVTAAGALKVVGNPPCFADAFTPPKPILYFRAELGRDPLFDVRDNPVDPTGQTGFASQSQFEMLVRPGGKWVREDYLIISAGPDGIYGPVVRDATTGLLRPAQPDEKGAWCDDIANFAH